MTDAERLARAHRAQILDLDAALARQLIDAYTAAWQRLRPTLDDLTARIQAARDAGDNPDAGWLLREERLRTLERRIVAEVGVLARAANGAIGAAQWDAIRLAQRHAREAVGAALGPVEPGVFLSFDLLPVGAVEALVANLGGGSPLGALLDQLGPAASQSVREALVSGVILGEGPATIARRARSAFGGNAVRALTVARTETMRAYHEGSRASYAASGVVAGWRWWASLTTRTCAFCWSQHGGVHPLNAPMATHPNCRCVALPVLKTAFAGDEADTTTGPEAFAALDPAQQRAVLGKAKHAAYAAGAIDLSDLAGTKRTRDWGRVGYERSLTSVLGAERTRGFVAAARA